MVISRNWSLLGSNSYFLSVVQNVQIVRIECSKQAFDKRCRSVHVSKVRRRQSVLFVVQPSERGQRRSDAVRAL